MVTKKYKNKNKHKIQFTCYIRRREKNGGKNLTRTTTTNTISETQMKIIQIKCITITKCTHWTHFYFDYFDYFMCDLRSHYYRSICSIQPFFLSNTLSVASMFAPLTAVAYRALMRLTQCWLCESRCVIRSKVNRWRWRCFRQSPRKSLAKFLELSSLVWVCNEIG